MIVFLVNPYGEQLRVQLGGSPLMALVTECAVMDGWTVKATVGLRTG